MKDITQNKHGGNANSAAAFSGIYAHLTLRQQQVLATIKKNGSKGRTCKEIAERHGCGMNSISGRLTELKSMAKIVQVGTRDGCAVWINCDADPESVILEQLRQAWHRGDREERQAIKITVDALKRDNPAERETVARRIEAHLKNI
jgi:phosphotransferase system HPr-like phosphotransfer protein